MYYSIGQNPSLQTDRQVISVYSNNNLSIKSTFIYASKEIV